MTALKTVTYYLSPVFYVDRLEAKMRKIMVLGCFLMLILAAPGQAFMSQDDIGTTAGGFLKLGMGGQANAGRSGHRPGR
jgi:hypothetical protein